MPWKRIARSCLYFDTHDNRWFRHEVPVFTELVVDREPVVGAFEVHPRFCNRCVSFEKSAVIKVPLMLTLRRKSVRASGKRSPSLQNSGKTGISKS
jgi:hypothetical protein